MKFYLYLCTILFLSFSFFSGQAMASAKTLPAGVWMVNMQYQNPNITQLATRLNSVSDNWDNGYSFKNLSEITLGDLELINSMFRTLPSYAVYRDTPALSSISKTVIEFNLAYGITDQLSFSFRLPYSQATVESNTTAMAIINALYGPSGQNMMSNLTSATLTGSGLGNPSAAFKYAISKEFAMAVNYENGSIKLGRGASDVSGANPNELTTRTEQDKIALAAFYDIDVGFGTLGLVGAYQFNQKGKTSSLLNLVRYDQILGNEITLGGTLLCPLAKEWSVDGSLIYFSRFREQNNYATLGTGALTDIPDSNTAFAMAGLGVTYKPAIFFETYARYDLPLSCRPGSGPFNFPGYLNLSGVFSIGATLYYK